MYRPEIERAAVERDVLLAPWTTLQLGGPARFFAAAKDENELLRLLEWAKHECLVVRLLGGGSNIVIADEGVDGLVIQTALRGVTIQPTADCVELTLASGEPWDDAVARAVAANWAGIEALSGIPGLAGATPIQNVGAYGQEISQVFLRARVLDRQSLVVTTFSAEDCRFGYRDSVFKHEPERWIVLDLTLRLRTGDHEIPCYGELAHRLRDVRAPSLQHIRNTVLTLRRAKSMVVDAANPNTRSAGSFFTNPIVAPDHADGIERSIGHSAPRYSHARGVKLPAAWLIERAGMARGMRRGGVGISPDHALALVHFGSGTTAQLLELAAEIRQRVLDSFGVALEPEPVLWGTHWPWASPGS